MDRNSEPDITPEEHALAERGELLVANAVRETMAPHSLRMALERDRQPARPQMGAARSRRFGFLTRIVTPARAGALAAIAVAVGGVALLGSGDDGTLKFGPKTGPTINQVASLHGLPSLAAPPRASHGRLLAKVDNVAFPSWNKLDWHASGKRADSVGGRRVTTVFYRGKAGVIGYSIVEGKALVGWPAGQDINDEGETYRVVRHSGSRTLVVWNQRGRTCVVDAPSALPNTKLIKLVATESV
jgi:hypothetical protein